MIDIVDHTLKHWRQTAFEYGVSDCLLSVGDYIVNCGGPDALASFRGTYTKHSEAMGHIAANGGPEGLLDRFGLPRINPSEAKRGDVVVILPGEGETGVGGICTGAGIALRSERGVIEVTRRFVTVLFAWKVDQCHSS